MDSNSDIVLTTFANILTKFPDCLGLDPDAEDLQVVHPEKRGAGFGLGRRFAVNNFRRMTGYFLNVFFENWLATCQNKMGFFNIFKPLSTFL